MYRLVKILLIVLKITPSICQSNLVIDSSFEQYQYIPDGYLRMVNISKVLPKWFAPTDGTPDYFHYNATNRENTLPINGYTSNQGNSNCLCFQSPRSGQAMVGFGYRKNFQDSLVINEYLQTKLSMPMIKNHLYQVSFFINRNSCSSLAISNIGAFLSGDSIRQFYPNSNDYPNFTNFEITIVPQVVNSGLPIEDTLNWVKINGVYKAKGGEKWLTIGHFKSFAEHVIVYDTLQKGVNPYAYAYYYLDDVSIKELKSVIHPDTICKGDSVRLTSNYQGPFKWLKDGLIVSLDSVYETRLFVNQVIILESANDIDTFKIKINSSAYFQIGNDTFICNGDSLVIQINNSKNSLIWSDAFIGNRRALFKGGTYEVSQSFNTCKYSDTLNVEERNKPNGLIIDYSEVCKTDSVLGIIKLEKKYQYSWQKDADTSFIKYFTVKGEWPLRVIGSNQCFIDTVIIVQEICRPQVWIPNAFVPNGLNNVFKPVISNVKSINMKIFNRWGELIIEQSGNLVEWDGKYKDNFCQDGLYLYKFQVLGFDGNIYTYDGVLRLIR